jgi:outer membrane receptor protein involved in Fe transport
MLNRWRRKFIVRVGALALVALAGAVAPAAAQTGTADITGRVVDQQGGALPGVTVVARNQDAGTFRQSVTAENGTYQFPGLTPGVYMIEAELPGFNKYQRTSLRLEVGKTVIIDITLEVGGVTEAVSVTGEAPLVDTTAKEVGGFVDTRELVDLPTANRNFTSYLNVLPGVVSGAVGGQPGNTVNYSFDGGSNNDNTRGGDQARIPIEAIQEFQLMVAQADAEYGSTGGVINAVSKQGTNEFHGSVLSLIRNSALTQKSYFVRTGNLPKPDTREDQYGGALGGPIIKNKMHFFGTYEQFFLRRTQIVNIPDRPDLNGTLIFPGKIYNSFVRADHQINANQTWGVKYLSEYAPNLNTATRMSAARTAEDRDQQFVGSWNSVLGNSMVNTLRVGLTREDYLDSSYAFKDAGGRQDLLLPTLNFQSFTDQQNAKGDQVGEHLYLINNTFNWFVPDARGSHNIQAGAEFSYTEVNNHVQDNLNGTFSFSNNGPFDPANPRSWPDQFSIRVPIESISIDKNTYAAAYVQDKWQVTPRLTISAGVRYELEIVPVNERNNPKFADPGDYPIDRNNVAPRTGFAYMLDANGRSVIRGGWGVFFQRTLFNTVSPFSLNGVYSDSFVVTFPANNRDSGPSNGRLPSDPFLLSYPNVNRDLLNQLFPVGTLQRNQGTVRLDDPSRHNPYTHQFSVGFERQLAGQMSASVDYVRKNVRDLLVQVDLNPGLRINTTRTGRVDRVDPNFVSSVLTSLNLGYQDIDNVLVALEKRFSRGYSFRAAYTYSHGLGNVASNNASNPMQVLDDLNLDENEQPTSVDRPHNLVVSGTVDVPKTGGLRISGIARYTSGAAFTISDSSVDANRNGILTDPLPAGTYSGTGPNAITVDSAGGINGARLPDVFNLDLRLGYRVRAGGGRTIEIYGDLLNATNFVAFGGISGDRRLAEFLRPTSAGAARALQIGARLAF